jgi:hypothetical protein
VDAPGNTFTVEFSDRFAPGTYAPAPLHPPKGRIEEMIVKSNNTSAALCIHACGYGYLNGLLAAAGFFEAGAGRRGVGLWLAGDFMAKEDARKYAAYAIESTGGTFAQGSTALHLARLLTLLDEGTLFGKDAAARTGMLDVLAKAAAYPEVWMTNYAALKQALHFEVTHNKLGIAQSRYSECSLYRHDSGKRFAVVWLNLVWGQDPTDELDTLATALRETLDEYVAP